MEENVALDAAKQKKFDKSIKGIKKLIKKKAFEPKVADDGSDKVKKGRVKRRPRKQRGLVYLSHIPHGFYEHEMTQYFKQFGVVTNARVIKSKRTGRSKGCAFVEFKEPAVGEIVAETMNNYLMGKRLIKASCIPPEKQKKKAFRKHWNVVNNPGSNLRMKMKKAHNENRDEKGDLKRARKILSNINQTKKKLKQLGIDYDFFTPVDVPEALSKNIQVKTETDSKEHVAKTIDSNANKKGKKGDNKPVTKKEQEKVLKSAKNAKTKVEPAKQDKKKTKTEKEVKVDKKIQQQKNQKLKDKGVTPMQEFIKVDNSENESDDDDSDDFDSDEYEKMLNDSELSDEADSDDEAEGDSDDAESESEEELPKQKRKKNKFGNVHEDPAAYEKLMSKLDESEISGLSDEDDDLESEEELPKQKSKKNKPGKQAPPAVQIKKNLPQKTNVQANQGKRKPAQAQHAPKVASPKKPKFEKQSNQKGRNKQFKKKK